MTRLFDLPQSQLKTLLATGTPVYLTVNPVEFHGPHLSLHNDRFISLGLIRDLHAQIGRGAPLLIADDLEVGVGPAPGPGSRPTPFSIVRSLIVEACERLADLGAQRVVIMTFHGDPLHNVAIAAGVAALKARGVIALSPFNDLLAEMLVLEPHRFAPALAHVPEPLRTEMLGELKYDFHAGFFETSIALHYAPETVSPDYVHLPPCPPVTSFRPFAIASKVAGKLGVSTLAQELAFAARGKGWHAVPGYPGYTSRPSLATPEAGAFFAREIVARFAGVSERVLYQNGKEPAPIMSWSAALSLNGRLA
jgi:creatinine amidohydrolase